VQRITEETQTQAQLGEKSKWLGGNASEKVNRPLWER